MKRTERDSSWTFENILIVFVFCFFSAMLEPPSRYPAGVATSRLDLETSSLETAVDLSRKNDVDIDADHDDSEDEAPLDLKVSPRL